MMSIHGRIIVLCLVLSTLPVSLRTAIISTVAYGTKMQKRYIILPHWTWPGREGEVTPVFVYTNYPTAELFIQRKKLR